MHYENNIADNDKNIFIYKFSTSYKALMTFNLISFWSRQLITWHTEIENSSCASKRGTSKDST